ncbi:metal-dependent hydrolase [Pontibacillus sp. ALD_SL1]|uniref:metal-dependent hydrolase n=1 Tax=Pontibacillus sp. ALD_SL1 TaxID=2777185 RepID=UPI001A95B775|nr:metal-dependent hydrolase [Pontibacillus sp. ALD_SL1]QSS99753.1 metal-dependent hydrolase [Pontibacillus sp. ALD_SL1]
MRYKTHIVSSLTAGASLSIMLSYPFHIGYVIGICFGSLLPDIDEPQSFVGRRSFGLSKHVKKRYGHRGITHSLFAWMLVSVVIIIYPSFFTVGISLGYLFHLIGDFFSVSSIPILSPFKSVRPKLPITYKTGSFTEDILLYIFTFLLFYLVFVNENLSFYLIQSTSELVSSIIHILMDYLKTISK